MITIEDMVECAERELGMRRRVYPGWVTAKKMTQESADHQTAAMEAIGALLRTIRDAPDGAEMPSPQRRAPPAQGSLL